jgi:hypothetical protein
LSKLTVLEMTRDRVEWKASFRHADRMSALATAGNTIARSSDGQYHRHRATLTPEAGRQG